MLTKQTDNCLSGCRLDTLHIRPALCLLPAGPAPPPAVAVVGWSSAADGALSPCTSSELSQFRLGHSHSSGGHAAGAGIAASAPTALFARPVVASHPFVDGASPDLLAAASVAAVPASA